MTSLDKDFTQATEDIKKIIKKLQLLFTNEF